MKPKESKTLAKACSKVFDSNALCYYDEYLIVKGKVVSVQRNAMGWTNHRGTSKTFGTFN